MSTTTGASTCSSHGATGELLLLLNQPGDEGRPRFVASLARGAPTDAVELGVGKFGSEARNRLVWIDPPGNLFAATLTFGGDDLQVGKARAPARNWSRRASRGRSIPWSFNGTTSSPAAGFCLGAIPRHPSSSTRSRPRLSGSASLGGASVTSTAMAWTTSSASTTSPVRGRPGSLDSLRCRTRATHTTAILTTTWTACPTNGRRARSSRGGLTSRLSAASPAAAMSSSSSSGSTPSTCRCSRPRCP